MKQWLWPAVVAAAKAVADSLIASSGPSGRVGVFRWQVVPAARARAFSEAHPNALDATAFFDKAQDVLDVNPQLLPSLKAVMNAVEAVVRRYPQHAVFVWVER